MGKWHMVLLILNQEISSYLISHFLPSLHILAENDFNQITKHLSDPFFLGPGRSGQFLPSLPNQIHFFSGIYLANTSLFMCSFHFQSHTIQWENEIKTPSVSLINKFILLDKLQVYFSNITCSCTSQEGLGVDRFDKSWHVVCLSS